MVLEVIIVKDNYIDQFGGKNDNSSSGHTTLCFVPATMGIICILIYAVYLWSALTSRSAAMALVVFVPILSIIGLIFSFVTRNDRSEYEKIWLFGLSSCGISFIFFILIYFGSWFALAQS